MLCVFCWVIPERLNSEAGNYPEESIQIYIYILVFMPGDIMTFMNSIFYLVSNLRLGV